MRRCVRKVCWCGVVENSSTFAANEEPQPHADSDCRGSGGSDDDDSGGNNGAWGGGGRRGAIRFKKKLRGGGVLSDQEGVCVLYLRVVFHGEGRPNQLLFEVDRRTCGCGCG